MRPLLLLAGLAMIAAPAWAQGDQPACYGLPDGSPPWLAQSLSISAQGRISLVVPGAPFVAFEMDCPFDASGKAQCGVDCDGGNVWLEKRPQGLNAVFEGLRFEAAQAESLTFGLVQFDADGLSFSGRFLLEPRPAEACDGSVATRRAALRPGDFHPAVARVERALAAGGYLSEPPDWYYTRDTAAAVRAFQSEAGFPVTGEADLDLLRRLAVVTQYASGGC